LSIKLALSLLLAGVVAGCNPVSNAGHGGGGGTGGGGTGGNGGGGNGGGGSGGCVGLQCQQMNCPGGGTTTLTGKVFAPNGTLPLYNAIVYVPNSTPASFTDGVTCDACNGSVSGDPIATAQTDATGSFTLSNVPAGANIPLVIQLGKWRRQVTIANVPSCTSTAIDATMTSLPSKHADGDIPKIAIATGNADPFECLLLKMGMDPTEITPSSGNGRIHFYVSDSNAGTSMPGATNASTMLGSMQAMMAYDILLLPCQGVEIDQNAGQRANLVNYVNAGGRLFSTHFSYDWLTYAAGGGNPASPFNAISAAQDADGRWQTVNQTDYPGSTATTVADLVTTFPKGMAFAQWLIAAAAMSPMNKLDILQIRHDINGVNPMYAQQWATDTLPNGPGVALLTFNTPLNPSNNDMGVPQYCGRVVHSDFHVAQSEANQSKPFPSACMSGALTDQEKALVFMLFDLSSCVQSDQTPPIP